MATSEHTASDASAQTIATHLRRLLCWLHLAGVAGAMAELLLLQHVEDVWQYVPLVLLGVDLALLVWWLLTSARPALVAFRWLMGAFVVSGVAGIVLHYRGNRAFELETDPMLAGWPLFSASVLGSAPALAPATMVYLAAIGLAFTLRHPVLRHPALRHPALRRSV